MTRNSNTALLVVSFLLAVGIVWIKGQEKIDRRPLGGIQVTVENQPDNLLLPDPWIPPSTSVVVVGPRNVTDSLREDQTSFRIDLADLTLPRDESPVTVLLTPEMFRTNLDPQDIDKIAVDSDSIWPRQVLVYILSWDVQKERPEIINLEAEENQIVIPLVRIEKHIPIVVPYAGELPEGLKLNKIISDPTEIVVTGRREAVERIQSVSTQRLDLTDFQIDKAVPVYLYGVWENGVRPVREDIRGVTVQLKVERARK